MRTLLVHRVPSVAKTLLERDRWCNKSIDLKRRGGSELKITLHVDSV